LALWDSDVSTLSEWNALLATHGISFEYVTYLNIESLHHNIHSEDLIRLRDTIIGIAQYVNLSPPIIRREVSDESAQEISQVTSSSRSKIFPCRNPFCEYRCGGSVTSERKPGIGSRLTADKQKSSSRICTAVM
jgi:hypothetical protein